MKTLTRNSWLTPADTDRSRHLRIHRLRPAGARLRKIAIIRRMISSGEYQPDELLEEIIGPLSADLIEPADLAHQP